MQENAPSLEAWMQQEGKALKPSFYVDRGDSLTQEQVATLVNALNEGDKGGGILNGVECECDEYNWDYLHETEREGFNAALQEYANTYTDTDREGLQVHLEQTEQLDALQDTFRDCIEWQNSLFDELVKHTHDASRKYGVQAVYGLTSRFWANEPRLVFAAIDKATQVAGV